MRSVRYLTVAAALLVGACAGPPPRPPAPPPPPVALDPDAACLQDLRDRAVVFEPLATVGASPACQVPNPVKVTADGQMNWNRPGVLSCTTMRVVERFEADAVQPAAQRYFGQRVVRLLHMGTYECRTRRTDATAAAAAAGKPVRGGRLSEHARGQAIDIGGFELADGTVVSVKRDWRGGGRNAAFLTEVSRAACEHFSVVLTPNYNAVHADHLHLDIGPHRLCGV
ncbi:extensin family protein [Magnetospirillum fulvum]|uniref:Extensin-like protein C-terminus n=1 Tax=Magnetospirillum fulvum TaxID=1082 RepID=A0A1H6HJA6_MAGFU|nr:extensin family protein [Magnetospirillum fulvum]SEH35841.1 Extensin-like protein C-terminus [Magnetospirillum fulvum]